MLSRLKSKHPYLFTLSFMEFIGYGTSIAALGYLTVFLQEVGLDAAQVGMVTAINSVVGMVASPFWGIVSDKMQSMRKTLLICMSVAMVLWFFVPASSQWFLWGMPVMSVLLPVTNFFRAPMSSLVDSWTVRSYYLVTGLMIGGALLLYMLTFVLGKKVFKIPLPDHVRSTHKQLQLEQAQKQAEEQAEGA